MDGCKKTPEELTEDLILLNGMIKQMALNRSKSEEK